ncbi:glycosyltransferase family 2 protein [Kushneria phosphatilytica]|uniref:Glycosyltransferase family 2 protein n=1 Tax=Kushneria phosphatilytica TaxID=657387 RepID=A0A1S1NX20_9GAMM|nr:glycosyltransferase family 2 protein [Kushneria phosphatilytica]OHV10553.1 glycosyl transferase [Kushneria phosphatilytica]QEL11875.1 glycosyltransferase family 2 protein [Kushneria phosphatilytica]
MKHFCSSTAGDDSIIACVLIPVYNHESAIGPTCEALTSLGLPIVLVDDGSHARCAGVLAELAERDGYRLLTLPRNGGKGAAVRAGLAFAEREGFTHALQVDADGQHCIDDLPAFIEAARRDPELLAIGYACYDHSVPRHRYYSRYITHVWVWCNTLSTALRDTMCGVRLYPLGMTNALLHRHTCGNRMEFDSEVLVRWYWQGGRLVNLPVRVSYPRDGISHFRLVRDNLLMARMHLRLTLGMLRRLFPLLRRRAQ